MVFHNETSFHIYFGDARDAMYPTTYLTWHDKEFLLKQPTIKPVIQQLQVNNLFFLHQVHGINGATIMQEHIASFAPFASDGDYLTTNQPALGLGIMAADCLPVVCVDVKNHAIGIAHVGWRGAFSGVVHALLTAMQKAWGTHGVDCKFFFGPSAGQCCYKVGDEFQQYVASYRWHNEVLQKKAQGYFLDVPLFVRYQLRQLGISDNAIYTSYNKCTICDNRFYSHRRDALTQPIWQIGRQMTIVALKKADC